jgi:uncharacterized membrane protein YhaH (DUF805 family)
MTLMTERSHPEDLNTLLTALTIAICLIQLLVNINRSNDCGLSRWLCLLTFIPVGNFLLILILSFPEGVKGTNKYGPDPRETDSNQEANPKP